MNKPATLSTSERLTESARRLMLTSRVKRLGGAVSSVTTEGNLRISAFAYDDEYPIVTAHVDETGFFTELHGVQTVGMGTLLGGASLEKRPRRGSVINVWAQTEGLPSADRIRFPANKSESAPIVLPAHLVVVGELTRRIRNYRNGQH